MSWPRHLGHTAEQTADKWAGKKKHPPTQQALDQLSETRTSNNLTWHKTGEMQRGWGKHKKAKKEGR